MRDSVGPGVTNAKDAPSLAQVHVAVAPPTRAAQVPVLTDPIIPITDISELSVGIGSVADMYHSIRAALGSLVEQPNERTRYPEVFDCASMWVSACNGGPIPVRGSGGGAIHPRTNDAVVRLGVETSQVPRL